MNLLCFQCAKLAHGLVVGDLSDRPLCEQCGSPVLGVLSWHGTPVQGALLQRLEGKDLPEADEKELTRTRQGGDLVAVYGKKAILALSVFGVGPQAAAKVLARMHRDDASFYRDLYEAKLRYIMTKPFWDRAGGGQREPVGKPHAYGVREGPSTHRPI